MFSLIEYIKYLLRSLPIKGVSSPFVSALNQEVIQEKTPFYCFDEIESIRAKLLLTEKEIEVLDLGAGSKKDNTKSRKISEITKSALKKPKQAQLLYRLAYHFKPKTILEIGTSLGITTSYLARSNPKSTVTTLEGSSEIAKVAVINFNKLSLTNIKQIVGNFDNTLKSTIQSNEKLDFVYFDGNHREESTLHYFNQCLASAHESSIFIFDDIYWSRGMKNAWEQIKLHPKVTVTIDLFEFGIVLFKTDQKKENFTIYH